MLLWFGLSQWYGWTHVCVDLACAFRVQVVPFSHTEKVKSRNVVIDLHGQQSVLVSTAMDVGSEKVSSRFTNGYNTDINMQLCWVTTVVALKADHTEDEPTDELQVLTVTKLWIASHTVSGYATLSVRICVQ
ncbi:hypothetical protein Q8A73_014355 [Channa argus]|nr:hypothetical protein Q8A73_014355 [Channa argus]